MKERNPESRTPLLVALYVLGGWFALATLGAAGDENNGLAILFGLLAVLSFFSAISAHVWKRLIDDAKRKVLRQESRYTQPAATAVASPTKGAEETKSVPTQPIKRPLLPPLPEALLSAFLTRSCVLFAGNGVCVQAGVPLLRDGWSKVLEEAMKEEPSQNWDNLRNAEKKGEITALVDLLRARLSHEALVRLCGKVFSASSPKQSNLYREIAEIPFIGILTTAWDHSLDDAFQHRRPAVLFSNDSELFGPVLREKRFFLLKINGDPSRPEAFAFTAEDYRRSIYEREPFSKFLGSVVSANTLLFAGASLATIEDFFSGLRVSQHARKHFALVPYQANLDFESERFLSRYGVQLLSYEATVGHPEVERLFGELRREIFTRPEFFESLRPEAVTLDRVILRNIGPFHELSLALGSSWHVLLGNNGCGKSTILRAIAQGLCGDEVNTLGAAGRLLKSGAEKGSIELWFGEQRFLTSLFRAGSKITVRCEQLTPFRSGRWLVLGFPPLRGLSQRGASEPSDAEALTNPDIKDLLPLLGGAIDARLDSIKQWIINTHLRSEQTDKITAEQAAHNRRLLNSFFEILGELTPGVKCSFSSVDRSTWEVMVKTDDGEVSIDLLSQGTSSIFGWVGILLQRLYEVFPNAPEPEKQPALVLVDEIDAHMHPEWQQTLVPMLRKRFAQLQVIATTHSPLIVGNMEPREVYRLRRGGQNKCKLNKWNRFSRAFAPTKFLQARPLIWTRLSALKADK